MSLTSRSRKYGSKALLTALFLSAAILLGGGGSPSPFTEVLLQMIFVVAAILWIVMSARAEPVPNWKGIDPLLLALLGVILLVPLLQLVPLPPALWTGFPGRGDAVAALDLVGASYEWRPASLVPAQTLAALLAMIPAAFVAYAVASLTVGRRRIVIGALAAMALASAALGAAQVASNSGSFYLYADTHDGWITGFQANRNAEADLLLCGLLGLGVFWLPYFAGSSHSRPPLGLGPRTSGLVFAMLALLLVAATAMTGSRTGIALLLPTLLLFFLILSFGQPSMQRLGPLRVAAIAGCSILALGAASYAIYASSSLGRVAARFGVFEDSRPDIWEDAWFALMQYWPLGIGMGGFREAIYPAERLEAVDATAPNRAHNDYIEIAIESGVLGILCLAIGAVIILAMAYRLWRSRPDARPQVLLGLGILLLIAAHSLVDYPLRSMAVASVVGAAVGLLAASPNRADGKAAAQSFDSVRGAK